MDKQDIVYGPIAHTQGKIKRNPYIPGYVPVASLTLTLYWNAFLITKISANQFNSKGTTIATVSVMLHTISLYSTD